MTSFEDRARAFETKYAHDEELRFRVTARRDKLFAHWAAEQLHFAEPQGAALTAAILAIQDGPGHDQRVLDHMSKVFQDQGHAEQLTALASALHRCADQAEAELIEHPSPTHS